MSDAYDEGWKAALEYQRDMRAPAAGAGSRAFALVLFLYGGSVWAVAAMVWWTIGMINPQAWWMLALAVLAIPFGINRWRKANALDRDQEEGLRRKWTPRAPNTPEAHP